MSLYEQVKQEMRRDLTLEYLTARMTVELLQDECQTPEILAAIKHNQQVAHTLYKKLMVL